jgi:hypothetical protein
MVDFGVEIFKERNDSQKSFDKFGDILEFGDRSKFDGMPGQFILDLRKRFFPPFQPAKTLSLFFHYNTGQLLILHSMGNVVRDMLILTGVGLGFILLAVNLYSKRDLPV